jgi:predicted phage-related endonuclease
MTWPGAFGHERRRYQDKEFTFLAAEIDLELGVDGEQCNVEIKTVHPFAAKAWGEPGSDEIPIYYAAQAMHGLMVTKRRRCIVAALIGADDLRIHEIVRDDETIAGIRAKELAFWQRVQDRNPPDPQTAEDVRWLYAKDLGEVAEADDELLRLVGELHFQKTTAKHAEAAIDRISTQIKHEHCSPTAQRRHHHDRPRDGRGLPQNGGRSR